MKIDFCTQKAQDGSIKYRFRTHDGEYIEALIFFYNHGLKVLCLSTQVGCDMGCKFCATGLIKRKRNLTQKEVVQQAVLMLNDTCPGANPDTITLAGMGEPLANYEASLGALKEFRKLYGDIRLSLSTVGLKKQIERMIKEKCSFGLYLSLHSANEQIRQSIMPVAKYNKIKQLISLLDQYAKINKPGTARVSYLLLQDVTDTDEQLHELARLLENKEVILQLRIWNQVEGLNYSTSLENRVNHWIEFLIEKGIQVCVRPSIGKEIQGACGQLANHVHARKIVPIYSFQDASESLQKINRDTLVIFDIDSVVTVPKHPILHPCNFKKHADALNRFYQSISSTERHFLNHLIIAHPVELVEKYCVNLIRGLQQQNILTIGLTNAKQGRFSNDNRNFSDVRLKQLESVGIDFSMHSPEDIEFEYLDSSYSDHPVFKKGIIFTCGMHYAKKDALNKFLLKSRPFKKIIFFEDKRKHLESILHMLKDKWPNCEYIGFQYKGVQVISREDDVSWEETENYLRNLLKNIPNMTSINSDSH